LSKRLVLTLLAIAVLLSMLITACAEKPAPTSSPAPAQTTAAPAPATSTIKPMTLIQGSPYAAPGVHILGDAGMLFEKLITERTGGAITFQNTWGAAMGQPAEYIDMMKNGTLDLSVWSQLYNTAKCPLFEVDYVFPFSTTDPKAALAAKQTYAKEFPQMAQDLAKNGAIQLSYLSGGPLAWFSKTPIKAVDDFKGKKVGVVGRWPGRWITPTGGTPVSSPAGSRYEQYRTGILDMAVLPPPDHYANKIHEQAKYYFGPAVFAACQWEIDVSTATFNNKLTPELQKLFVDTGADVTNEYFNSLLPTWLDKIHKTWEAAGVQFSELPASEITKWSNLIDDVPGECAAELNGKGYPGDQIVQRWQEIIEGTGYTWPREWGVKK